MRDLMESDIQANILLVDDRPENLLALESILEQLGQNLVRAASAHEALRFLLLEDVALILLDVQMPGVNGFELAELIRERERTQHTPIIFVTAISDNENYIFKGYSLGAVDYLTKPVAPEILRSKVRFFIELFGQNEQIKRQAALLEESNARLDNLNTDLEHRVAERTAELKTANRELEKEIAVRTQSEARLATQHSITRTLADSNGIEDAGPPILQAFCEHMNAQISCLWVLNATGAELTCSQTETCGDPRRFDYFVAETRRTGISAGLGVPGRVWKENAPVWLANDFDGEKYPRAEFAAKAGLHGAVGFPIKIQGVFYGVIEFFTPKLLQEDLHLLSMLEAIGSEIGQFIQRKSAEADRERLLLREKALREQAEQASLLKDEFLATVSHELRTPLNAIIGWCQIIQDGRLSPEEQKTALDTIHRNAKSQAKLIDDLLDTSRLISGNLRLDLSPVQVAPAIEEAIETVRPAAEAKGISIATEFISEIASITCDARRLQQMVWNLLTNGVKFTPKGGRINVKFESTADALKIIVSDNGHGISREFLPHVFDRFRQADSSSTRSSEGIGIGLAIVRHLVELHGGKASAASDGTGKGSAFTLTFPQSPNPSPGKFEANSKEAPQMH